MEHTPGPWTVNAGEIQYHLDDDYAEFEFIAEVNLMPAKGDSEANARLIAAAPALLEALEGVSVYDGRDLRCLGLLRGDWVAIRAAIKLAKGD